MVFVGLIVALVALVWGLVFYRRAGLIGGCLAVLISGSVLGHSFFHASVGPLPVTLDRMLLAGLMLGYLIARRWSQTTARRLNVQDWLLLGFFCVLSLATVTHDWRIDNARPLAAWLFFYCLPACLYVIAREAPLTERAMMGVLATFVVFACYLAAMAVCEVAGWDRFVFPRYITSAAYDEFLGRGRGPFLNPAANGLYLCLGVICLLMLWRYTPGRWRWVLLAAGGLVSIGVFCTLTRCVWLAAIAAVWVLVLSRLSWRRGLALTLAGAALALALVALNWQTLNSFKRDRNVSVAEMAQSASLRPLLARVAWTMTQRRPVWGYGFGQYVPESRYWINDRSTAAPLERVRNYEQHNILLSLLVETGMVGCGLFVLFLVAWLQTCVSVVRDRSRSTIDRRLALAAIAIVVAWLCIGMFQDLAIVPMVNMVVLFWAGMIRNLQGMARRGAGSKSGLAGGLSAGTCRPATVTCWPHSGQSELIVN